MTEEEFEGWPGMGVGVEVDIELEAHGEEVV